jgi:hypothetical protein
MSSIIRDEQLFSPLAVALAAIGAVGTVVVFFVVGGATPMRLENLHFTGPELRSVLVPSGLAGGIELVRNIVPNGFRALVHMVTTVLASVGFVFMMVLLWLGVALTIVGLGHPG